MFKVNEVGEGHALKYIGYELFKKHNLINKFKVGVVVGLLFLLLLLLLLLVCCFCCCFCCCFRCCFVVVFVVVVVVVGSGTKKVSKDLIHKAPKQTNEAPIRIIVLFTSLPFHFTTALSSTTSQPLHHSTPHNHTISQPHHHPS